MYTRIEETKSDSNREVEKLDWKKERGKIRTAIDKSGIDFEIF